MSFKPLYTYIDRDTLAQKVRQHGATPSQKEIAIVDVRGEYLRPELQKRKKLTTGESQMTTLKVVTS